MTEWINLETIQDYILSFFAGREFMIAAGGIIAWLTITAILRWFFGGIFGVFNSFFSIFSAMRWRRMFFQFISLIFMVGGVASASAAKSKMEGGDGVLEAIVGGGITLAIWSFIMLILGRFNWGESNNKKTKKKQKQKPSKVKFPSGYSE